MTPSITPIEKDQTKKWRINKSSGKNSKTSDFNMSGDGSLGYWYQETRNSSSHHHNEDDIYDDKSIGVSADD